MSNPTGNALKAIGIKDTQRMSSGEIRRALNNYTVGERGGNNGNWSKAGEIAVAIFVGAFVMAALLT